MSGTALPKPYTPIPVHHTVLGPDHRKSPLQSCNQYRLNNCLEPLLKKAATWACAGCLLFLPEVALGRLTMSFHPLAAAQVPPDHERKATWSACISLPVCFTVKKIPRASRLDAYFSSKQLFTFDAVPLYHIGFTKPHCF
jgi:hypothetical protein